MLSHERRKREMLARTFGCVRYVYNSWLALRRDAYRERQESLYYRHISAALTLLKQQPETSWQSASLLCAHPNRYFATRGTCADLAFFEG